MPLPVKPAAAICLCLLLVSLLAGCASVPQTERLERHPPADIAANRLLEDVPFFAQKAYQCGPASLAMVLNHSGLQIEPDTLVSQVYIPEKQGAYQVEMLAATRRYERLALEITPEVETLLRWVDAGTPVLVLQNLGLDWYPKWHYAVVIGYDLNRMEIVLHSGEIPRYTIPMSLFERTWARGDYWGMVALAPGGLPLRENAARYLRAAAALEATRPGAELEEVWKTGTAAWPDNPDMVMGLANHYYGRGATTNAAQMYRRLIAEHPDYIPAYNNLASLLIDEDKPEEAIEVAREGLKRAGGSHRFLERTLAEAIAVVEKNQ